MISPNELSPEFSPELPAECFENHDEHSLVSPSIEVRNNLGMLAVQVLAARENLAEMDSNEIIRKLYDIVSELHTAYNEEREHNMPL